MGTYTHLTVDGYPLLDSKSEVIADAMTIFRETDRRVFMRRRSERNKLVWGNPQKGDERRKERVIEYACETGKVVDRLNIMGFTLRRTREDFERHVKTKLQQFTEWTLDGEERNWFAEEQELLSKLTFDGYQTAFAKIMRKGLRPDPFDDYKKSSDPLIKYILSQDDDWVFHYFGSDFRFLIRMVCDVVPADSWVIQDISDLVEGGYYKRDEPVCQNAINALTHDHPENAPRIILTEGSADATILRQALDILYPHLSGYYSFLEFETSRTPGGAGQLVSVVKAFSGAGITNRIVALFDNDTAAHEATRALRNVALSPNIAIRHYPDLQLLRSYPTLGPGGLSSQNVNGLAASIELYLGKDVLADRRGRLTPVQWKGYSEGLKQYHGEVSGRAGIRSTFDAKVKRHKANPRRRLTGDWSGLDAILKTVFHAFN